MFTNTRQTTTLSLLKYNAYKFFQIQTFVNIDNACRKTYQHLERHINIVRLVMKCSFILYIFGIVDVDILI